MAAGQDYRLFWDLTPVEVIGILDGAHRRRLREHDDARARHHELAMLIGYAFHDPKSMPEFRSTTAAGSAQAEGSGEMDQERVRAWFMARAQAAATAVQRRSD